MCNGKYLSIYIKILGWVKGGTWLTSHFSFTDHKKRKKTKTMPIIKSNYKSFISNKKFIFPKVKNKKVTKGGTWGPHSNLYGKCALQFLLIS